MAAIGEQVLLCQVDAIDAVSEFRETRCIRFIGVVPGQLNLERMADGSQRIR